MLDNYVKDLVHGGFAVVPSSHHNVSVHLIEGANEASQNLIRTMSELRCETGFSRLGEGDDKDIGLIERIRDRDGETKFFLHYTHELRDFIEQRDILRDALSNHWGDLAKLDRLRYEISRFIIDVLKLVEIEAGDKIDRSQIEKLPDAFIRTYFESITFSTTVLRSLWYPPTEDQVGAEGHLDRDFLTAHLGDRGGKLYGHRELGPGKRFDLSPSIGEIALFWGVRAPIISNGFLKPLYHSADAHPGEDRQALVQFNNLPTPQLQKWKQGLDVFYETWKYKLTKGWYARAWQE